MMNEYSDEILLISKCGSFSKAAEQLGITQPALSFRIKKMEEKLGAKIFERTSDKSLTKEGEILVEYLKKRKLLDAELQNRLDDLHRNLCGSLVIGSTHGFALGYLPYCVQKYAARFPNVNIQLIEGTMPEIEQKAREGEIDIFITGVEFESVEFEKEFLFREDIFLCVPPHFRHDSRFKDKIITKDMLQMCDIGETKSLPQIDLALLSGETFILLPEDFNVGRVAGSILGTFTEKGKLHTMVTNQMTTGVALSQRGLGISFVTEDYVRYVDYAEFPALLKVNAGCSYRNVYVAYAKRRYLSKAAHALLDIIKE